MGILNITLIDVGWGDSIFIEHVDDAGNSYFGLVDSNDSKEIKSTRIFIERFFRYRREDIRSPLFDFILLSHPHDDHSKGLEGTMRRFGTVYFWHPDSDKLGSTAPLIRYCNRSIQVQHIESLNSTKYPEPIGDLQLSVLWPLYSRISDNENNNSVVLGMKYKNVSVILSGDAEEEVWGNISGNIPNDTIFFKVPHHGSRNGSLDNNDNTTWLRDCQASTRLGISCMYRKDYKHPHQEVLNAFHSAGFEYYRTDEHYHVTFSTDGINDHKVKYSHV